MNILVPMGGWDRYFREEDFAFPKPLVEIAGKPMIEHTLRGLRELGTDLRFTFVVRDEDCRRFSLDNVLRILTEDHEVTIVRLQAPTQGAVCSCLMAIDELDPDEELVISNSDQAIGTSLKAMMDKVRREQFDGGVLTFDSTHPRFAYIRADEEGLLTETSEKRVISRNAIAGLYYFKRSQDFIDGAMRVLTNASMVQGSYFISQVLNELILDGRKIGYHGVAQEDYFPLYTPQKVSEYEEMLMRKGSHSNTGRRPVLLIPMAGEGRRFVEAKYSKPKPLIDVGGKPMVARVLENLAHTNYRTVAVVRSTHLEQAPELAPMLQSEDVQIVPCEKLTEGTACTVLLARKFIESDAPLIIANCDQIVDFDCSAFVQDCIERDLDGSILVFKDKTRNPKWSYAKINSHGLVTEVKEKVAISDLATVGIYLFAKGSHFIDAAIDMIVNNDRVNNEFYTCPVYNYMISSGLRIGVYEVAPESMHGIGVPEDLEVFLAKRYLKECLA